MMNEMEIKRNEFKIGFDNWEMIERTKEFFANKHPKRQALKDMILKAAQSKNAFLYCHLTAYIHAKYFQLLTPVFMGFESGSKIDVQYAYFMELNVNEYFGKIRMQLIDFGLKTVDEDWILREWADSFMVRPFEIVE